jgi:hypothetical protein
MPSYEFSWRCKWLADEAESIPQMVQKLRQAADELEEMHGAGVVLDNPVRDDYAFLSTEDPAVAERFGFYEVEDPEPEDEEELEPPEEAPD